VCSRRADTHGRARPPVAHVASRADIGLFERHFAPVPAEASGTGPALDGDDAMKTILVVDDDAGVRGLLRRVIGDMGYRVIEAADALSALEVLEHQEVTLALVDIRMPGRDGVWLVDQILARHSKTPVALATGLSEMDPHVTLRAGVVGYVVKPFKRADLAKVIRAALLATPPEPVRDFDLTAFDLM
jgi:CheY-like chemotaxis protein